MIDIDVAPRVEVPERFNAASYFVDRNIEAGRGEKTAIEAGDRTLTYADVAASVNRTGNALRELGLEMEQRVLLALLDCPEFAFSFFGAIKIGAVPVPANTLLTSDGYRHLLADSRAKVLVVSAELLPVIEPALADAPHLKHVLVVGERPPSTAPIGSAARPYHVQAFEDLMSGQEAELTPADTGRDDVAFWLYSSGTTGFSRAAVHLQHDMVHCVELYAKPVLGINENDRTFSIAKLFFAYGLGNALYFPFAVGATTILNPGRPDPASVFDVVNKHRPTVFYGVPTAYAQMLQAVENGAQVDMSPVRVATSAGEALPPSVYQRWLDRFGVHILDGIGTTEILHIFLSNRLDATRPGSSGRIVPGYEARIVDENGEDVPPGEIGNLMVKGDSTCAYYWNQHASSKWAIKGEWIRTGDKYHVDEDGYYWYDGRADDMLKAGGIWVSPVEVEATIMEHPAVLECAVVGKPDEENLTKPKAFVVLKQGPGNEQLARDIQQFVKQRIAPYKYPRWIEFVDELPKTATGKIQRFKLRQSV